MYQYIHAGPNILLMFWLTNFLIYDIIPQNLNAGGVHMDNEKNLKDELVLLDNSAFWSDLKNNIFNMKSLASISLNISFIDKE